MAVILINDIHVMMVVSKVSTHFTAEVIHGSVNQRSCRKAESRPEWFNTGFN